MHLKETVLWGTLRSLKWENKTCKLKKPIGDVTQDDSQRRFLAQHSVAMMEQCCINIKTMLQR